MRNADARFGGRHLLLGELNFGLQAVRSRRSVVQGLLRLHASFLKLLRATKQNLCVLKLNLIVGDGGLGGVAVGFGGIEGALDVGIIERGEELPLRNACAFVEEYPGDAAGNLGSDGRAASRRDVAAGIQGSLSAACFGLRGCGNLHHRLLTAESVGGNDYTRENEDRYGGENDPLASSSLAPLAIVDAERSEVRFCGDL